MKRLLCLLRRDHGRLPRYGGAGRGAPQVDVLCGRCGQTVVEGVPLDPEDEMFKEQLAAMWWNRDEAVGA